MKKRLIWAPLSALALLLSPALAAAQSEPNSESFGEFDKIDIKRRGEVCITTEDFDGGFLMLARSPLYERRILLITSKDFAPYIGANTDRFSITIGGNPVISDEVEVEQKEKNFNPILTASFDSNVADMLFGAPQEVVITADDKEIWRGPVGLTPAAQGGLATCLEKAGGPPPMPTLGAAEKAKYGDWRLERFTGRCTLIRRNTDGTVTTLSEGTAKGSSASNISTIGMSGPQFVPYGNIQTNRVKLTLDGRYIPLFQAMSVVNKDRKGGSMIVAFVTKDSYDLAGRPFAAVVTIDDKEIWRGTIDASGDAMSALRKCRSE